MVKALAVVSADWHLRKSTWKRLPQMTGDAYYGLSQVVRLAKERECDLVAAGDLFDVNRPDSESLQVAFDAIESLRSAGRRFFFIQGQHDLSYPPYLSLHSYSTHVHKKWYFLGPLRIYGLDYQNPDRLESELENVPRSVDILVFHQVWCELTKFNCDYSLSKVPPVRMIITGDCHRHQALNLYEGLWKRTVLSPGSLCMQSVDEETTKNCFLLYDDLSFESVPIKSRKVIRVGIFSNEDLEKFLSSVDEAVEPQQGVPTEISKNLIIVSCAPELRDAYARISRAVKDRAFILWKIVVVDSNDADQKRTGSDFLSFSLTDCLAQMVDRSSAVYKTSARLISSNDPARELERIVGTMRAEDVTDESQESNHRKHLPAQEAEH